MKSNKKRPVVQNKPGGSIDGFLRMIKYENYRTKKEIEAEERKILGLSSSRKKPRRDSLLRDSLLRDSLPRDSSLRDSLPRDSLFQSKSC